MNKKTLAKIKCILGTLVSLSFLVSCAAMKQQWVDSHCTKEEAYSDGMNAARGGKPMNEQIYSQNCPNETKAAAMAAYQGGYENGLKSIPAPATTVIIQGDPSYRDSRPHWRCQVDYYGTFFDALGFTEAEARAHANARFQNEVCVNPLTYNTARIAFSNCSDHSVMDGFSRSRTFCEVIH